MADKNNEARGYQQPALPAPDLRALDRLVGAWEVSGDYVEGTSTFEWMEGGFFLLQRYDFGRQDGHRIKGIEVIVPQPK